MKNDALVSIAMITYNGEKYLEQQLESIYAQTYKNIEVIVCDDNSNDATIDILKKYEASHGLKFYINDVNLGINKNFEKAFSFCKGDFIAPSDQDDIWLENKIQTLVDEIQDNTLIYTMTKAIDENGDVLDDFAFDKDTYIQGSNNLAFLFDNCVSGHTTMFKKDILPYMKNIVDVMYPDWWSAFVASTYGSIKFLKEPLVLYRRHNAQATNETSKKKSIFNRLKIKEQSKKEYITKMMAQLEAFRSLSILDEKTKEYISKLIYEFKKFDSLYYNKKLEQLLKSHENDFFAMHNTRIKKYTKKLSKGIWYYRSRLYS